MTRITTNITCCFVFFLCAMPWEKPHEAQAQPAAQGEPGWRSLFNGKDLSGWETWLRASEDKGKEPLINMDPEGVFTVVKADGEPAIRVSGKRVGGIGTKEEFENYHFRIEFKWGNPSGPSVRGQHIESGILYHASYTRTGKLPGGGFPSSLEFNVNKGHVGDFWGVLGPKVDVEGRIFHHPNWPGVPIVYEKGGQKFTVGARSIFSNGNYETHAGEWNVVEILCVGPNIIHVLNGGVAMRLTNARFDDGGKEVPVTRGKIQLQSEGAELFFRRPQIRPIKAFPSQYLP